MRQLGGRPPARALLPTLALALGGLDGCLVPIDPGPTPWIAPAPAGAGIDRELERDGDGGRDRGGDRDRDGDRGRDRGGDRDRDRDRDGDGDGDGDRGREDGSTAAAGGGAAARDAGAGAALAAGAPLGLDGLQMLARRRYPAVEAWRARIRAAEARLYAARAAFFPLVSAEGRYLRLEDAIEAEIPIITLAGPSTETVTFQETEAFSLSTQLRYTLFDWSRNQLVQGARAHELRAEEWWRRRALQEVDWAVARGYFGALLGRSDIEVLQASALALERAVTEARQLLDAGRATEADVLVLEATLERRRFEVRQAEDLLRDFEEELRRLLDLEPDASMPLAGGESEPEPPPALPRLEGLAIERRPEFRELREREEALRADSRAAGASWLPEFFFFVQNDVTDSPTVLTERTLFSGGFGVSWTVFDGGRRFHEMHALRAEAEALFAGQRELRGAIVLEVRKAHRDGARAIEGVAVARSVVESAGENLLRVEERFRAGGATGQELLEAEALLTSERARLERALHGARLQRARLRLALGLDPWEPLAPP